jgi:hypothetical protein
MDSCGNSDVKFGCFVLRYNVKCMSKRSVDAEKVKATPPLCSRVVLEFDMSNCYWGSG